MIGKIYFSQVWAKCFAVPRLRKTAWHVKDINEAYPNGPNSSGITVLRTMEARATPPP
jgi:hypothetical protein